MTGKTLTIALALAAGLLVPSTPLFAQGQQVAILQGQSADTTASVTSNEGGTGITVHRGPARLLPGKSAATEPNAYISGKRVALDNLEPTGQWFLDRSGDRLVVVHCYGRQSIYVGGGRRIRCTAREL